MVRLLIAISKYLYYFLALILCMIQKNNDSFKFGLVGLVLPEALKINLCFAYTLIIIIFKRKTRKYSTFLPFYLKQIRVSIIINLDQIYKKVITTTVQFCTLDEAQRIR